MAGDNRFLSIPYLFLRSTTAGGAVVAGLIQTFVFARIVSPERFSIFILVGTLGVTLWLFDFGIAKILFVRTREWYLKGCKGRYVAERSGIIVILYTSLVLAIGMVFLVAIAAAPDSTLLNAVELSLFFVFTALNLVWFVLRNLSVAIDDFVNFETLEVLRRIGHMALMLAMLIGLPLLAFLIVANLVWAGLFALSAHRLMARRALALRFDHFPRRLQSFFRANRKEVMRTGTYGINEFFIYHFPYAVVPYMFGLGAPTIVLDTTFKVFRGATLLYSAGCDIAVPRQTRAFAERDRPSLILATLMAAALGSLPALLLVGLLVFGAEPFFALLLGPAATMPPQTTLLLVILLVANLAQTVANFLLVHTGFFREIAALAVAVSVVMATATGISISVGADFLGFLTTYTAVYVCSALAYLALAIAGPIRTAQRDWAAARSCAGGRPPL